MATIIAAADRPEPDPRTNRGSRSGEHDERDERVATVAEQPADAVEPRGSGARRRSARR